MRCTLHIVERRVEDGRPTRSPYAESCQQNSASWRTLAAGREQRRATNSPSLAGSQVREMRLSLSCCFWSFLASAGVRGANEQQRRFKRKSSPLSCDTPHRSKAMWRLLYSEYQQQAPSVSRRQRRPFFHPPCRDEAHLL
ncbi:hypothetical protein AC579_7770 [Pseudocercospora musae]|uniref:Uncharacterized protein n=1 Tax=Pseudocercospora musae TaxID=113226 RepID=A0A139IJT5_9PEZI|nr:hypothetical protein AC579_7770 [Pseudocercospora musae]